MRARSVLRAVGLLSTIAGLLAVPAPSFAAPSTKSKTAAKSTKKPTSKSKSSKSSASKSTQKPAATASKTAAPAKPVSPAKAAYDPVAATTPIPGAPPAPAASAAAPPQRGPTRIDFDDRLIQGQTNKSGAVYLYDRKELKQRSMIKKRETFREEIVGAVYDSEL
jgi:cytoskeletal protein RodZ